MVEEHNQSVNLLKLFILKRAYNPLLHCILQQGPVDGGDLPPLRMRHLYLLRLQKEQFSSSRLFCFTPLADASPTLWCASCCNHTSAQTLPGLSMHLHCITAHGLLIGFHPLSIFQALYATGTELDRSDFIPSIH